MRLEDELDSDAVCLLCCSTSVMEALVSEAKRDSEIGIKGGGLSVNMVRYTDAKAVVFHSHRDLLQFTDNLNRLTRVYDRI